MGEPLAQFLFQFSSGEADALTVVLYGQAHGAKIGLLVQDGFAPAPCLDLQTCQSLLLVTFEPSVDDDLAAVDLHCDGMGAQILAVNDLALEQDHAAALAVLVRLALSPGFFQSGTLLVRQRDAFRFCHEPSLTLF